MVLHVIRSDQIGTKSHRVEHGDVKIRQMIFSAAILSCNDIKLLFLSFYGLICDLRLCGGQHSR